jgi:hypothetical protein
MDQFVGYLVGGGIVALSVWARFRFYKPSDTRELPRQGSVDLSGFGAADEPPRAAEPAGPRAD